MAKQQNYLINHQTNWPIWYALLPLVTILIPSLLVGGLSSLFPENTTLPKIASLFQMIVFALLTLGAVWLFSRKKPSRTDLGLDKRIDKRGFLIIGLVFIITHLLFQLLAKLGNLPSDAVAEFKNLGLGNGFLSDLALIISGVILAPICEEIIYRGIMLRSLHDGSVRWFKKTDNFFAFPVIFSITLVALAFIMPHVSNANFSILGVAYFITSAGFSVVYILTGSLQAAMLSHVLQSWVAYSTILIGSYHVFQVSPIIYLIAFLCPLIVYFLARCLGGRLSSQA